MKDEQKYLPGQRTFLDWEVSGACDRFTINPSVDANKSIEVDFNKTVDKLAPTSRVVVDTPDMT